MMLYADFGTSLDLATTDKGNCLVDNHTAVCIFYTLYNWEEVEYDKIQENNKLLTKKKRVSKYNQYILFIKYSIERKEE